MADEHSAAARRIMNRLGEDTRLPIVNIREGDVGVLLGFPVAGLFIGASTGFGALAITLLFVGFGLGVATVYASPPHLTAWEWLRIVGRYVFKRPRVTHSYRADDANPSTEGGWVEYTPFSVDESTQELTNVERAWPGAGAIERTDGTMEAFVELEPANMDFAMAEDWQTVQEQAEEFANNELDFPLTFYATTQAFPVERLVAQLDSRFDDPDVESNPVFRELLGEYLEQRPADLAGARQFHFYLGVEVDRMAVYHRYEEELTPGEQLVRFPVIGPLFNPFVTRREDYSEAELRAAMFEKLDDRIRTVRTEFVEKVPGWSARRLDSVELFVLNAEFWNGEEYCEDAAERLVREQPVLDNSERVDAEVDG
ncbi:hypothetical protein HWV07_17805 [Natronomonas salina]|uniref:hypothetical protein n=1 Tax=Natronomonas salina TaxID=1710540 RepID=UPI0015B6BD26|nr:hypothetical protein HWV07_17805 [Natronomonas salina]